MTSIKTLSTIFVILAFSIWTGCGSDPSGIERETDETAPMLVSATIGDATPTDILLTFDEPVLASGPEGFAVIIDDFGATISSLTGSGTSVLHLVLPHPVLHTHTVTVQYEAASGDVMDLSALENRLASFGATAVTNNITDPSAR